MYCELFEFVKSRLRNNPGHLYAEICQGEEDYLDECQDGAEFGCSYCGWRHACCKSRYGFFEFVKSRLRDNPGHRHDDVFLRDFYQKYAEVCELVGEMDRRVEEALVAEPQSPQRHSYGDAHSKVFHVLRAIGIDPQKVATATATKLTTESVQAFCCSYVAGTCIVTNVGSMFLGAELRPGMKVKALDGTRATYRPDNTIQQHQPHTIRAAWPRLPGVDEMCYLMELCWDWQLVCNTKFMFRRRPKNMQTGHSSHHQGHREPVHRSRCRVMV